MIEAVALRISFGETDISISDLHKPILHMVFLYGLCSYWRHPPQKIVIIMLHELWSLNVMIENH